MKVTHAFTVEHRNIPLDDCPDNSVVNSWILMSQLISEVHDSASSGDAAEDLL